MLCGEQLSRVSDFPRPKDSSDAHELITTDLLATTATGASSRSNAAYLPGTVEHFDLSSMLSGVVATRFSSDAPELVPDRSSSDAHELISKDLLATTATGASSR